LVDIDAEAVDSSVAKTDSQPLAINAEGVVANATQRRIHELLTITPKA